jgi:hypothetical protein
VPFRVNHIGTFIEYLRASWKNTEDYLASPDESAFERMVTIRPLGEMPAARGLGQVVMTHGFQHLGEIDVLRTIQGKPSAIGT